MKFPRSIVHMTSVHPPYDQRILLKECVSLAEAGYKVTYIVPHSHDEEFQGVTIRAVVQPRNRRERMLSTVRKVYRAARREDAAAYHFHDPELIPVGILLKLRGKRVVYDTHEDIPRTILTSHWIPRGIRRPVSWITKVVELLASRILDGVVAATPAIARRFPASKTSVIQNFPLPGEYGERVYPRYGCRDAIVIYVGLMSIDRCTIELIKSIEIVNQRLGATLVLAGNVVPPLSLSRMEQMQGWRYTKFLGWLDRNAVAEHLGQARIGLVVMQPIGHIMEAQPTKLFEYMAAGIPVVASDFPIWRSFVETANCGILVDPLNAEAIADAVLWLLEHPEEAEAMGQRGKEAIASTVNWANEARILTDFYQNVVFK